ncbi:MAG: DNA polymerase IV [Candidatus Riflebacteria bacterium]|nr:DNA polymerase IV [Candidatus Riflebacteria bacterium]
MKQAAYVDRIACVDLDAFFVEVALKKHPEMRGRPLAVCGSLSGRGVVCSASYEARPFGVKSGLPVWKCKVLCPAIQLLEVPSEVKEYSDRVRARLRILSPVVETASIDEFYLDFRGCERIYPINLKLAGEILSSIVEDPALPCSIGFGRNKLVAKIASDIAKPCGVLEVFPGAEARFLSVLSVKCLPGVGPRFVTTLNEMGIHLIRDVLQISRDTWKTAFGMAGEKLYDQAHGISEGKVVDDSLAEERRQISRETTLSQDTSSIEVLAEILSHLVENAVYDLRKKGLTCSGASVKIRYSDFSSVSKSKTIERTDRDDKIFPIALELFKKLYMKRMKIRLIGVKLFSLLKGGSNYTIDDFLQSFSGENILKSMDEIRSKHGKNSVMRARSLVSSKQFLRRSKKSKENEL